MQTGHHGSWEISSRVGTTLTPRPYHRSTGGIVRKGRSYSTRKASIKTFGVQVTEYKSHLRIPDWLVLREITDDNIRDWTPGEPIVVKKKKKNEDHLGT